LLVTQLNFILYRFSKFYFELRKRGISGCRVVEKNVRVPERFFDNHYKADEKNSRLLAPFTQTAKTHLKNVFWPPAFGGIGASFQILRSASGGPPVFDPQRL
jgi:hypothetical protein